MARVIALVLTLTALAGPWLPAAAAAEEMTVIRVEMRDGKITPLRIEVTAGKPFKLEIYNLGKTPAEFESRELHREKVLAPGAKSFLVFRRLSPGRYRFFDDFHPSAPHGVIISK
jgi:hypothetical protein